MMVKICGITNRDDALAAAESGASALGFNFYPGSPRYLAPEAAQQVLESIQGNVLKIGVFVNESPARISTLARELLLDIVQLHGDSAQFPEGLRTWRALRVTSDFDLSVLDAIPAEACLLDAPAVGFEGGTGRTFDWTLARGAVRPIILAGGLDETNVRRAIETARPWGVDACSRLESSPGRKDHRKMERFIREALS
jgi:phosphoribosylanthranilate isomerase